MASIDLLVIFVMLYFLVIVALLLQISKLTNFYNRKYANKAMSLHSHKKQEILFLINRINNYLTWVDMLTLGRMIDVNDYYQLDLKQ